MRLGRITLGLLGLGAIFAAPSRSGGIGETISCYEPPVAKSKPNRISQAKRRKHKRQGRG